MRTRRCGRDTSLGPGMRTVVAGPTLIQTRTGNYDLAAPRPEVPEFHFVTRAFPSMSYNAIGAMPVALSGASIAERSPTMTIARRSMSM